MLEKFDNDDCPKKKNEMFVIRQNLSFIIQWSNEDIEELILTDPKRTTVGTRKTTYGCRGPPYTYSTRTSISFTQ